MKIRVVISMGVRRSLSGSLPLSSTILIFTSDDAMLESYATHVRTRNLRSRARFSTATPADEGRGLLPGYR